MLVRASAKAQHISPDQLFKKPQIAMKNPSFKKYNMILMGNISVYLLYMCKYF